MTERAARTRETLQERARRLEPLRQKIAIHLLDIEQLLTANYVLTLIARHRTNNDAHIIVTGDDVWKAIEAVNKTDDLQRVATP